MDAARFRLVAQRYLDRGEMDFEAFSNNENKNTKRKTETDMRIFSSYLVSINELRQPETIPAAELDRHLSTYFSVIKKHDGNEYEPASLRGMLCSIERYLRAKNYPVSLTRDADFANTRNMLKERQRVLREMVKSEKISRPDPTALHSTVQKLNQLYMAKEFGPHNPSAVINALCFSFIIHLKIRKAIDHKQLLWGDIVLKVSSEDEEYLCYEPLPGYEYLRLPLKGISGYRVYAQNPESSMWDPIAIYKLYRHKRPSNMLTPESPFYLGVAVPLHSSIQQPWFKPVALGVNKLNDLVRMIRDITGTVNHGQTYQCVVNSDPRFPDDDSRTELDLSIKDSGPDRILDSKFYRPTADDVDAISEPSMHAATEENVGSSSALEKVYNEDTTKTEFKINAEENDDDKDVEAEVEDAKQKIQAILGNLVPSAKTAVKHWLGILVEEFDSRKPKPRKRLHIQLDLDEGDLEAGECVEKQAKIQILTEQPETDLASRHQPIADDTQSADLHTESGESLHKMRQSGFKQALSQSDEYSLSKLQKSAFPLLLRTSSSPTNCAALPVDSSVTDGHKNNLKTTREQSLGSKGEDGENVPDGHTIQSDFPKIHTSQSDYPAVHVSQADFPAVPTNQSKCRDEVASQSETFNSPSVSSSNLSSLDSKTTISHAATSQSYNPYAAWALDPRFAMFMRNGFIQTYQDFISMYSNPEGKPS